MCVWHVLPDMGEGGRQAGRRGEEEMEEENKFSDVPYRDTLIPSKTPYSWGAWVAQ